MRTGHLPNLCCGYQRDKYLTAIKLSKEDAKLLNLNENDPAIMINDNIHLSNGLLFNTSNIIYNYQATNFYSVAQ